MKILILMPGAHSQISSLRTEDQPRPSSHNQQSDPSTSSSKQKKEKVSRKRISSSAPARHARNKLKRSLQFYKDAIALHHLLNNNETL